MSGRVVGTTPELVYVRWTGSDRIVKDKCWATFRFCFFSSDFGFGLFFSFHGVASCVLRELSSDFLFVFLLHTHLFYVLLHEMKTICPVVTGVVLADRSASPHFAPAGPPGCGLRRV